MSGSNRRQFAVVGSGVTGLTAAYLLQRVADVTLYEADDRLGGHAQTHTLTAGRRTYAVDSGFIVHNPYTYPLLSRLLAELGVVTQPTGMSLSVRCDGCGLQYAGARGPTGLFAQPANAASPRFAHLLTQVPRFHRRASAMLKTTEQPGVAEPTLREFLDRYQFSAYFVRHFVVPLVSAVWSCTAQLVLRYPARYLFTFLAHHRMLDIPRNAGWRTITGGSRRYVDAISERVSTVRTSTPVRALIRHADGVTVHDAADEARDFTAVVVATHPDQALRLLCPATNDERAILNSFSYSTNEAVLHTDPSVLPSRSAARAAWNLRLPDCEPGLTPVSITYDLNHLHRLDGAPPILVTLNPGNTVDPTLINTTMQYEHPIYTSTALAAQRRLPELDTRRTVFAGAYHGWGFHEDGCRSGAAAAAKLGAPW